MGGSCTAHSQLATPIHHSQRARRLTTKSPDQIFLSHNIADKEFARRIASALSLAGGHVWFDEWIISPGDSIPGAISQGLQHFTTFALVWSEDAAKSRWVGTEVDAAISRWVTQGAESTIKIIPIVLDATPLPAILSAIRRVDGSDDDHLKVSREILGLQTEVEFRLAIQSCIGESGIDFQYFHGAGIYVACPKCGALPSALTTYSKVDERREREYRGVCCNACGWSDCSEVW